VARVRPVAERKRIAITVRPMPGELQLSGDRELMEYACYNLLTNAVKYSPQRTEVTVTAAGDQGQVRIAVQDQGIGMDSKEVKQIFHKFYRTKKGRRIGGSGHRNRVVDRPTDRGTARRADRGDEQAG
jgi:signal transduction histidine kinase